MNLHGECCVGERTRKENGLASRERSQAVLAYSQLGERAVGSAPTTAAAAATTTTAAAATAAATLFSEVNVDGTTIKLGTVQIDSCLRAIFAAERHEPETARAAGVTIGDNLGLDHFTAISEIIVKSLIAGCPSEAAYKNLLRCHLCVLLVAHSSNLSGVILTPEAIHSHCNERIARTRVLLLPFAEDVYRMI